MGEKLTMSKKEIKRIKIMEKLSEKVLTVKEASEILGISQRQVYRIKKRYKSQGAFGLIHKLRGRESNRGYSKELKKEVIKIYRSIYKDFGPTLYSEKLEELHKIKIDHETIRRWLRSNGEITSIRRSRRHRKKRERKRAIGQMLQFDGSPHDWFEGRGEVCSLLHAVDDASGKVFLRFAPNENTDSVLKILMEYVQENGIPHSIYTDRFNVYYAEKKQTDFQKAMEKLSVRCIYAHSPQAKGRVERGNRTLQDRLVKEMRLRGISDIDSANKFLREEFIDFYNNKFSIKDDLPNIHTSSEGLNLDNIFCRETKRQVRNDYTVTLKGQYIQLEKSEVTLPMPKENVTIRKYLDGSLHIFHNEDELSFKVLKGEPSKKRVKIYRSPSENHPWRGVNFGKNRRK